MKPVSPYRSLPADRRLDLVTHLLATDREARESLVRRIVARPGGFRLETVRKRTNAQLANDIVRFGMENALDEARLLQLLYVELEPGLQMAFLDAAGVAHEQGVIPEELQPPFADVARVRSAALALLGAHGEDGRQYLRTILIYNAVAWPGLADVLSETA
jgi:hypothetical protein